MGEKVRHVFVVMAGLRKGHEVVIAGVIHEAPEVAERCARPIEQDHQARQNDGPHVLREFRACPRAQDFLKGGKELLGDDRFHI